jgi:hypothetical protein
LISTRRKPVPDDTRTIDVPIPVETTVASALNDAATRAIAGRMVSHMLQPASLERLVQVMDAISVEAERRGLTDEILDAELDAYNAERRDASSA